VKAISSHRPSVRRVRLALLAASPVYYQVPLYRRLAKEPDIEFTALFASSVGVRPHDGGYSQAVNSGLDCLTGYKSRFLGGSESAEPSESFFSLRDLSVVRELLEGRYDVLWMHGYNFLTHALAATAQRVLRRPILLREEQNLLHPRVWWKAHAKRILVPMLFRDSIGLYIGRRNREWFRHYGVREDRLFFVPYCVDNERLQLAARELHSMKGLLRKQFGLTEASGPVILWVGRMIPKKQPLFVLDAFRQVRLRARCSLVMVGSGSLEGELRKKVANEAIPDVHLAGFLDQTQIVRAYASADIFVLASRYHETWGIVVNEAMNFGLPVVASDKVGAAHDLVKNGVNGFIVNSEGPSDLAEKLAILVSSRQLREQLGSASRQLISAWNYDVASAGLVDAVRTATGVSRVKSGAQ
jgi:glycosyltransferase involved in cell wall biosynthesis